MKTYIECWIEAAAGLLPQAVAGEPQWIESQPQPLGEGTFGFAATLGGDIEGRFSILLSGTVLETPLLGEGIDQKVGWGELMRETMDAAAGELLAASGMRCRIEKFEQTAAENGVGRAFELKSGERSWMLLAHDESKAAVKPAAPSQSATGWQDSQVPDGRESTGSFARNQSADAGSTPRPGLELLLDVELEASLRFGSRELALSEILELGPGDVVQLDRNVSDPVDLIVGDKIVARGEVVLVSGNFGLRVTEVATPRKRLESIRCLF